MSIWNEIKEFIHANQAVLIWIGWISMGVAVISLGVVFYLLLRLPKDYFSHFRHYKKERALRRARHPVMQRIGPPVRIFFGCLLILVGFILLFMPGQGVLTMIFGLVLLELSIWDRFLLRTVARPNVLRGLNRTRERFGRKPFIAPDLEDIEDWTNKKNDGRR